MIHVHLCQDVCNGEWVADVWVTAATELPLVSVARVLEGALDIAHLLCVQVFGQAFFQRLDGRGSRDAIIMIEAGAKEVSEEVILDALRIGQENNVKVIDLQDRMVREVGLPKTEVKTVAETDPELLAKAESAAARCETESPSGASCVVEIRKIFLKHFSAG